MKHLIFLLLCVAVMPAQAGLYRWVDADGKVHYGDAPPPEAKQLEAKKLADKVDSGQGMSYETYRAQQNFPVTLYVTENCTDACNNARNLLSTRGIPYSEKMLKTQAEVDAFKKLSGSDSAPTLAIGRNYLKGFQEKSWHNELSIAGYPKESTYRAPAKPAAPVAASQPAAAPTAPVQPATQPAAQ